LMTLKKTVLTMGSTIALTYDKGYRFGFYLNAFAVIENQDV
jgi:hypothetical protein